MNAQESIKRFAPCKMEYNFNTQVERGTLLLTDSLGSNYYSLLASDCVCSIHVIYNTLTVL